MLNDLDLKIKFGEIIGIKGGSGTGKTTLMNFFNFRIISQNLIYYLSIS